jgi:hypothetical protein
LIPIFFKPRQTANERSISGDDSPSDVVRRNVIKASAVLTGVLAAQSAVGLLAPSLAWALEVSHLNQTEADTVQALAKTLFPHKGLPDAVYALVVKEIDDLATTAEGKALISTGVRNLSARADGQFAKKSVQARHKIVAAAIQDPFVQKVRSICITSLYTNEMAFAHFGYQGEAFSKGGYVFRGFNELTWLPNPPASASPPVVA